MIGNWNALAEEVVETNSIVALKSVVKDLKAKTLVER